MTHLVIVHLYPRELGINGDAGNVLALRRRAAWRGIATQLVEHAPGDELPESAHLVHIGSGPASAVDAVRDDVLRIAPRLREWAAADVPFLAIGAGWHLLGREHVEADGTATPLAGVYRSRTRPAAARVVGEVAGQTELGDAAGYLNHAYEFEPEAGVAPLLTRTTGAGAPASEGMVDGALVGTGLHGSFLPMNPHWADHLLDAALRLTAIQPADADSRMFEVDADARRSREAIRRRVGA